MHQLRSKIQIPLNSRLERIFTKRREKSHQQTCCSVEPETSHRLFDIPSEIFQLQLGKRFDGTI